MANPELGLVSTDDLITALLDRCDHGVVAIMRIGVPKPELIATFRRWRGNPHTCAGLALDVASRALESSREEAEPLPPEEG